MYKKLTIVVILLLNITVFSQITNEGKPLSWKLLNDSNTIQTHILPKFDVKKLHAEDKINDKLTIPFRFGFKHEVNLGFNDGQWNVLDNGDRIWRIKFQSKDALSLNFIFDNFYLPKGSTLYLYNEDRSDLLGAYTSDNNNKNNSLGTWIVQGDTVWIEYFEPADKINKGKLTIDVVTHAYRNSNTAKELKNLGSSDNCNQDVDCPIGADWEDKKDHNKKAVGMILTGGSGWCSGALINNVNNDGTPYFLTANHCTDGANPANLAVRFGWISPNPVCATTANSTNGPTNMQMNGTMLRANNSNSDFALLEFNNNIPTSWDRTWAGWDNTDTTPNFVVGIHHPAGDIMKICRDNAGTIALLDGGVYEWEITSAGSGWEIGVTEVGSSGSPLFNQDGSIIGQLHRGSAACNGTVDNGGYDQYGRFAKSWDDIAGNSNQLKPWLDPTNTGQSIIGSYPPQQTYTNDASITLTIPELACGETEINPSIALKNNGTNTLTNVTIEWNLNNGANTSINWTGSLVQNAIENISLGAITLNNGTHTLNATITTSDENSANNTDSKNVIIDVTAYQTTQIHLDLLTDNYCEETSWTFKNAAGTILYSGGNYTQNQQDNTLFTETFNVTNNQCYTFEILDSENDGICCVYGNGSYSLTTDNGTVIFSGGDFGSNEITEIVIANTASIKDELANNINIYPNPTKNTLNVNLNSISGDYRYSLINTLGQKILNGNLMNTNNILDISTLEKGVYFLKIKDILSDNNMIKKIIIN